MNTKVRKQTLRQRLRIDASFQLGELMGVAIKALEKIAKPAGLKAIELAKILGSTQNESLEKTLITKLADRKEAELEEIYNAQKADGPEQ